MPKPHFPNELSERKEVFKCLDLCFEYCNDTKILHGTPREILLVDLPSWLIDLGSDWETSGFEQIPYARMLDHISDWQDQKRKEL